MDHTTLFPAEPVLNSVFLITVLSIPTIKLYDLVLQLKTIYHSALEQPDLPYFPPE